MRPLLVTGRRTHPSRAQRTRLCLAALAAAALAALGAAAFAAPAAAATGVWVSVSPSTITTGNQVAVTGSCGENVNSATVRSQAFTGEVTLSPNNGILRGVT